jgi:hypothetical protein
VTRKSGTNAGVTPEHHPREGTPRALRGGGAPQEGVTPGGSPQEGHLRRGHLRRVTPEGPPQEGPPQEGYLRRVPPTSGGSPQICASGRIVVVTTFWHSRHLAQRYVAQVFLAANLPFWLGIGAAQKGAGSKPLERRHWVASLIVGILGPLGMSAFPPPSKETTDLRFPRDGEAGRNRGAIRAARFDAIAHSLSRSAAARSFFTLRRPQLQYDLSPRLG